MKKIFVFVLSILGMFLAMACSGVNTFEPGSVAKELKIETSETVTLTEYVDENTWGNTYPSSQSEGANLSFTQYTQYAELPSDAIRIEARVNSIKYAWNSSSHDAQLPEIGEWVSADYNYGSMQGEAEISFALAKSTKSATFSAAADYYRYTVDLQYTTSTTSTTITLDNGVLLPPLSSTSDNKKSFNKGADVSLPSISETTSGIPAADGFKDGTTYRVESAILTETTKTWDSLGLQSTSSNVEYAITPTLTPNMNTGTPDTIKDWTLSFIAPVAMTMSNVEPVEKKNATYKLYEVVIELEVTRLIVPQSFNTIAPTVSGTLQKSLPPMDYYTGSIIPIEKNSYITYSVQGVKRAVDGTYYLDNYANPNQLVKWEYPSDSINPDIAPAIYTHIQIVGGKNVVRTPLDAVTTYLFDISLSSLLSGQGYIIWILPPVSQVPVAIN